ncbi:aminopeptidase P family protein [bacterium]|nr:aminopeptidase P family protein [bacterium]
MVSRISDVLKRKRVDAFLVTQRENIAYLSGFYGSMGALLISEKPVLFVDGRYYIQAKEQAPNCEIVLAKNSFWDVVSEFIKNHGIKRLGFEDANVTYRVYRSLKRKLKGVSFVPLSGIVEKERIIKKDWEIERMRKAQALAEEAVSHCLNILKEGICEKDLAREFEFYVKGKGAELAFESIVAFGERSALPHAKPTERKLKKGDIVLMDVGARVDGYCSDMTRVFFFGKPEDELLKMFNAVLEAQNRAIEGIREGKKCGEIDALARECLNEKGYGELFTHSLGHGIGREVHEMPGLAPNSKERLVSSAIVTVEPGIYVEGLGGIRIEDMVLVGKKSCEDLTHFPKEPTII